MPAYAQVMLSSSILAAAMVGMSGHELRLCAALLPACQAGLSSGRKSSICGICSLIAFLQLWRAPHLRPSSIKAERSACV